jgi:hypothetical protein
VISSLLIEPAALGPARGGGRPTLPVLASAGRRITAGPRRERPLARNESPSPRWDIYLVRSTPAQFLGVVEAPNADAATEAAVRALSVNAEHAKLLTAILKSRHPPAGGESIAKTAQARTWRANRLPRQ